MKQAAVIMIVQQGKVLLLLRPLAPGVSYGGHFGFPGGMVEDGETPLEAALRETEEEAGLVLIDGAHIPPDLLTVTTIQHPDVGLLEVHIFRYEVHHALRVMLGNEHCAFMWADPKEPAVLDLKMGAMTRDCVVQEGRQQEAKSPPDWIWPLLHTLPLFPDEPGGFGVRRRHDVHTGVDLYCIPDTVVMAVEAGTVISIENFTGSQSEPPSPWWNDTKSILVQGDSGVIVYGEVEPFVQKGESVSQGQHIAKVIPVLKKDKGRPRHMLHFEYHESGSLYSAWWHLDEPQPDRLLDPTERLVNAAGHGREVFDLKRYDSHTLCVVPRQG